MSPWEKKKGEDLELTGDSPEGDSIDLKVIAFHPEVTECQGYVPFFAISRKRDLKLLIVLS